MSEGDFEGVRSVLEEWGVFCMSEEYFGGVRKILEE